MEEILTLAKGIQEVLICIDFHSCSPAQLPDVFIIHLRILYRHGLVRTPCRKHLRSERILLYLPVVFKGICRVICRADNLYVELSHKSLSAIFLGLELGSTLIIDRTGSRRLEDVIDFESPCKLKMCPVIKRISHGIRNGFRPFFELFIAPAWSRDEFFRDAVASQSSPFVVVTSKPYFCKVLELIVVSYHLRIEVAVVVYDRHMLSTFVIEFAGIFIRQHEVIVDERLLTHDFINDVSFNF